MTLGPGVGRTLLPEGFFAAGVNCGVRRYRPDIGVIVSDHPAVAAAVYTLNSFPAAPVTYCRSVLPSDSVRAVFTNSGQANAATGDAGVIANLEMVNAVAKSLDVQPSQVLMASTGVIGQAVDLEKVIPAIPDLKKRLTDTAEDFALAIMTTDLVPKTVSLDLDLSGGTVRITGICKGSGMIHPNMATMLGYILTDVKLSKDEAQSYLKFAVDESFNMISVDGDSSTNDTVFLLANGAADVSLVNEADHLAFKEAVKMIAISLAQLIAIDGEGATKLVEVRVTGARDLDVARRVARSITISPLIKTAMHGEDPNWGRILARIGAEEVGADVLPKLEIVLQGHMLFQNGGPLPFVRENVKSSLKKKKIEIEVKFNVGDKEATAWGCDLSKKYVEINTEYN
jgi:glutamate N-acetyltransferase / amino-acid N-acetyltransferase